MGFSISWIAVQGKSKDAVLSELRLWDTGEPDEANEAPVSGVQLPGGWYALFLDDLLHPFTQKETLSTLSRGCTVVVCQVEEHVMASAAFAYSDGVKIWDVTHESETDERHLSENGALPAVYASIKQALLAQQDASDADDEGVDYVWDIPITLAYEIVGYRHDQAAHKCGDVPVFTRLNEAR